MIARVLIADQRPHVSRIVAHQCCRAGFDVIVADDIDDAVDALNATQHQHVDLAILCDAWATTLQSHINTEHDSSMPFIIIRSGHHQHNDEHLPNTHAAAHFTLPCRVRNVVRAARTIINEERRDNSFDEPTLNKSNSAHPNPTTSLQRKVA